MPWEDPRYRWTSISFRIPCYEIGEVVVSGVGYNYDEIFLKNMLVKKFGGVCLNTLVPKSSGLIILLELLVGLFLVCSVDLAKDQKSNI